MANIIDARVRQKIDTEANWLANPLVILQGEQAFVSDNFNFKIGDGTKTFSELEYYYKGDILGSVATTSDLAARTNGVYRARTSGTYAGIVVKQGYYTLLRKSNGVWSLETEVNLSINDNAIINYQNGLNVLTLTLGKQGIDTFDESSISSTFINNPESMILFDSYISFESNLFYIEGVFSADGVAIFFTLGTDNIIKNIFTLDVKQGKGRYYLDTPISLTVGERVGISKDSLVKLRSFTSKGSSSSSEFSRSYVVNGFIIEGNNVTLTQSPTQILEMTYTYISK